VLDFVPKDHVSRFIVALVRESLDLREITGSYVSGLGQPPFDPRMMVALCCPFIGRPSRREPHKPASLYEAFPAAEARRLVERVLIKAI
jgi:hypothetical protein